eukprot:scaffold269912_cov34-Prasinocladus_malaysianus.AAC.1
MAHMMALVWAGGGVFGTTACLSDDGLSVLHEAWAAVLGAMLRGGHLRSALKWLDNEGRAASESLHPNKT